MFDDARDAEGAHRGDADAGVKGGTIRVRRERADRVKSSQAKDRNSAATAPPMKFRPHRLRSHAGGNWLRRDPTAPRCGGANNGARIGALFLVLMASVLVLVPRRWHSETSDDGRSAAVVATAAAVNEGGGGERDRREEGGGGDWKWFDGDLGAYYDSLERDERAKRKPHEIASYAVHRWLGPSRSTLEHYGLIRSAIYETVLGEHPMPPSSSSSSPSPPLRVFDAGCGLGAGLMWMEQAEPTWTMVGHTISEEQHKWITEDLPEHRFSAKLRTYDEPLSGGEARFDAIYSIEAAVHSPDLAGSLRAWSGALEPGGAIVIIDDFLSVGVPRDDPDVDLFARSWLADSVHSTNEVAEFASKSGMKLVRDRDLGSEYQVIKLNYRNKIPELRDEQGRAHQGWLGSKVRQRLTVQGKITYRMVVLRKNGDHATGGRAAMGGNASNIRLSSKNQKF